MSEEQNLKLLPYGISRFHTIREKNRYYVDKTRYIKIIEDKGDFLFFVRPRRFGKSLFLSTMELYYDINQKENFDAMFKGTDIHQNPTVEKNSYLVLKLDFSAVEPNSSNLESAFFKYIRDTAMTFLIRYKKLLGVNIKEAKAEFTSHTSAATLMNTFLNYCMESEQKLYVIIDEYDNFANTILSTTGTQEYLGITHGKGFFRAFFNVLKSGTSGEYAPISRLFMTGVSPITLDDVTSGFNIATNISLDDDINEMVGFNRAEVEALIEYYRQSGKIPHSTSELLDMMSYWYNHYRFSMDAEQEVFNSVQVLYFLREYLKKSIIPQALIDENIRMDYNKIRHLIILDQEGKVETNGNFSMLKEIIENGSVHATIKSRFPISELTTPENFISLLYYFGLLTIIGSDEENNAILAIPNETIKRLYYDYIKASYEETGTFSLNLKQYSTLMNDMAFHGNWEPLIQYITTLMAQSTGLRDYITGEKVVQAFLNVYLGLTNLYYLHSEREFNKGYADLVMEPFLAQYPTIQYAYFIELKYLKATLAKPDDSPFPELDDKIKALRREAETQLHQYALDDKFQKTIGQTKLRKLVLVFAGHRLVYHGEA